MLTPSFHNPETPRGHPETSVFTPSDGVPPRDAKDVLCGSNKRWPRKHYDCRLCVGHPDGGNFLWPKRHIKTTCTWLGACGAFNAKFNILSLIGLISWSLSARAESTLFSPIRTGCFFGQLKAGFPPIILSFHFTFNRSSFSHRSVIWFLLSKMWVDAGLVLATQEEEKSLTSEQLMASVRDH